MSVSTDRDRSTTMLTPTVPPAPTVVSPVPTSPVVTVPQRSSSDPAEVSDSRTLADVHPSDTPDTALTPDSADPTVVTTLLLAAVLPVSEVTDSDPLTEDPQDSVPPLPTRESEETEPPSTTEAAPSAVPPTVATLPDHPTEEDGEHCDLDIVALKRLILRNNCVQYSL